MTIIKKDVNKIGTAWSRKVNTQTISDNGTGAIVHAMVIPPYVWPGYMWSKWTMIDPGESGVHPKLSSEANVFIQMAELPDTLSHNDYDTEAEVLSLANTYAPVDEVFLTTDSGTDDEVGFTGGVQGEIPPQMARTLCARRHYKLGMGSNSYPTNADEIRYFVQDSYKGHLKTAEMVDIAKPKLVLIRANTQVPTNYGDESYGMSGELDVYALYEKLVDNIPGRSDAVADNMTGLGADLDVNLHSYLNYGLLNDETAGEFFNAQTLQITNYVTTRLDIYEPAPRGHINPRGNP